MSHPFIPAGGAPAATDPTALERRMRPALDASALPTEVFGSRGTIWWGNVGFMIVETMTLAVCVASYFYLRRSFQEWPPPGTELPDLLVPTVNLVVLLATIVPYRLLKRRAEQLDTAGVKRWLVACLLAGLGANVVRALEFTALNTWYDVNAYGSAVWAILVTHTTLLLVDLFETGTLAAIFFGGKQEAKHYVDATDNANYSYFMILAWVPLYAILYLYPRWG